MVPFTLGNHLLGIVLVTTPFVQDIVTIGWDAVPPPVGSKGEWVNHNQQRKDHHQHQNLYRVKKCDNYSVFRTKNQQPTNTTTKTSPTNHHQQPPTKQTTGPLGGAYPRPGHCVLGWRCWEGNR